MADQTRRFYADSSASYVLAIIHLMEYARSHDGEDFDFGPLDSAELRAGGLVLSGPELTGPLAVLSQVPGLEQYDPGAEEGALARLALRGGLGDA